MTRKGILPLSSLIIIAGLIIIFSGNRSPFGKKNTSLAVPQDKEITSIDLTSGEKKLVLSRNKDSWFLDNKTEARRSSINFITRILKELTIKSPVSDDMFNREITQQGIKPVRVRAYENRRLLCDFFVYKTGSNVYGNIMKKNKRSKPFIFYVPGHDNDIGSVFTTNELYWQSYTIFNLMPSEISSIMFENQADTSESFRIKKENNTFVLSDGRRTIQSDSSRVMRYLSYFTFIPFESWALDLRAEDKEKIISKDPVYRIKVVPVGGQEIRLTLWQRYNEKGEPDSDRLYGKTEMADEIFIVRYFDLDPILKKREYFVRN